MVRRVYTSEQDTRDRRHGKTVPTPPTLKADDGTVSPEPLTSPAIGRSQKRDEASSVRNRTERACERWFVTLVAAMLNLHRT